jgi:CTP:molybdopterin cytidylyltransferase MocA
MIGKVDAVLLAGGGTLKADRHTGGKKASTQDAPGTQGNKALLTIGGRPMVDYVIEALKGCPEVDQIVLVGDAALQKAYHQTAGLLTAAPGDSPLGSLASGAAALETAERPADWVLTCTGDIPFLTAGAVSGFLGQCSRREADFYYPITARREAEARFPGVKRTYARLRDGAFTGGNLFLVRRSIIKEVLPKAEGFIRLRKKPLSMARLVGPGFLFAYLFGFLTIAMAEKRISGLVGYRGAAVISDYPEIGVDVDKLSDLDLARRLLAPSTGSWLQGGIVTPTEALEPVNTVITRSCPAALKRRGH